ncbi:NAD-dependent epimerase/dehydratase family protein [Candidatus Fonsibacter ubiquis]|uniref:NAD-dependent epimerase/dehydratase family protein n=1 Tax=Candidatus Fonsibacter ubiquis TaxID=1925548 RepID=UPI000C08ACB8|nr:NAD-dependent epimerase/dehydratase family protein [Candidatus Fonsibacter ubiquis]
MRNILVVTGGAGFIGSNLISELLKFKKFYILSIDDYSSGLIKNHINNKRVKYLKGSTKNIEILLKKYITKINTIFHFGEFARIYQSFNKINECFSSNIEGSSNVFNFSLKNKIRLIYSATSASLGNKGEDMNLSPYAFSKAKNLELLENLRKWFRFRYEVIYFYNVYGEKQICEGDMATVVGIFENHFLRGKKLPIVKPGTQVRRFTHVFDTIKACIFAWKKNKCKHYSIASKESYSIIQLAKMFKSKIRYLPRREGERYASALTRMNLNNKIIRLSAKIRLKDYINNFLKNKR